VQVLRHCWVMLSRVFRPDPCTHSCGKSYNIFLIEKSYCIIPAKKSYSYCIIMCAFAFKVVASDSFNSGVQLLHLDRRRWVHGVCWSLHACCNNRMYSFSYRRRPSLWQGFLFLVTNFIGRHQKIRLPALKSRKSQDFFIQVYLNKFRFKLSGHAHDLHSQLLYKFLKQNTQ
jgi:hypothetical protein